MFVKEYSAIAFAALLARSKIAFARWHKVETLPDLTLITAFPFTAPLSWHPLRAPNSWSGVADAGSAVKRLSRGWNASFASETGLTLLTQSIAFENTCFGLRADVVCASSIRTEMSDRKDSA